MDADTFYSKDWGYTLADFEGALSTGLGNTCADGVSEFASLRAASALAEAIIADAKPLISFERVIPRRAALRWTGAPRTMIPVLVPSLHYRIDGGNWESTLMGAPAEIDPVSGISTYRDTIRSLGEEAVVDLYFTVNDQGGQLNRFPDTFLTVSYPLVTRPPLYQRIFSL